MQLWWLFPVITLASWVLTYGVRRYALLNSVIDVPNSRSSHTLPTPRGGGLAIVVTFILSQTCLVFMGYINLSSALAFTVGGGAIAALGFLDDHRHIPARWRLLGHFAGSAFVLLCIGGMPPVTLLGFSLDLGWAGEVLAVLYVVWLLNLYNFMDGIDGLASVEAVFVCGSGALLYFILGHPNEALGPLTLVCATLGFLLWNFPPAKIFMGDAGSGYLGILMGALSLQATWVDPVLLPAWLILLGVFIVDATVTLIRRLLRGEKVYEAHRSHAYQFASRHYGSHLTVTMGLLVVNIIWLLPLAIAVSLELIVGWLGMVIAYTPLAVLAIRFHAGQAEHRH